MLLQKAENMRLKSYLMVGQPSVISPFRPMNISVLDVGGRLLYGARHFPRVLMLMTQPNNNAKLLRGGRFHFYELRRTM